MRDAAVGHQCPSCVKEGVRSTRATRAAYGGERSANPYLTTKLLIGANLAVWALILATGWHSSGLVDRLGLLVRGRCTLPDGAYYTDTTAAMCPGIPGAQWIPGVADGAYWQLLTHAFTHVEIWHIASNMIALWFLGPRLEAALGRSRFLALYFVSALAGGTAVYWLSDPYALTVGASGAGFGMIGAFWVIARKVHGDTQFATTWLAYAVVFTVLGWGWISWQGHFGGLLGGLAAVAAIVLAPRAKRGAWQLAGLGLIALVLVVAIAARTLVVGG